MSENDRRWANAERQHRDPFAGIAGAAPARSALTLRAVLAVLGLLAFGVLTAVGLAVDAPPWLVVLSGLIALTAAVDLWIIAHRMSERGSR